MRHDRRTGLVGLSMARAPEISVVIGAQHADENLPAILQALGPGLDAGTAEVLLCHPQGAATPGAVPARPGLVLVEGGRDALIPELWRDGIRAARAERLAVLSAHCVPAADWLDKALSLDVAARAGYGGIIVNDARSDAVGAAIHYLRYTAFARADRPAPVAEIAADNAVYRRSAILDCADLLTEGFWEPPFHARFRRAGQGLEIRPDLRVTHVNRYTPRQFMRQRRLHGRNFGRTRAAGAGPVRRWAMLAASPAAFPVFAAKQLRAILSAPQARRGFARAAPWFALFMASWSLGEMQGYWDAATGGRR